MARKKVRRKRSSSKRKLHVKRRRNRTTRKRRNKRNVGHFSISFAEANRVRRMKGRKRITRGQYNYRVARNLPVTI